MEEIYDDFFAADLIVAHNAPFDIGFMINEFYRRERRFRYKEEFDTMRYFTPIMKLPRRNGAGYKFPKLTELGEFLDIYPYDVTKKTMELFDSGVSAHDARYDTTALYLCFNEGAKNLTDCKKLPQNTCKKTNKRVLYKG